MKYGFVNKNWLCKLLCMLVLTVQPIYNFALGDLKISGARQAGMGLNSIGLVSVYSAYNNQAAGAYLEHPSFGIYYSPVFIGLGVNNLSGVIVYPMKKQKMGTFGVSIHYFGYTAYSEKKVGLSYAIKLAKYISIGVQLDYINAKIQGYGSKNLATFELGVFARPIPELSIAMHVYNPVKIVIDKATGEKLPIVLRAGVTYEAIKRFFISAQIDKDFSKKLVFRAGVEYTLKDLVSFRAGVATDPVAGTFGVGVKLKQGLGIDVACTYQANLGFSPHFGILYEIKKKKKIANVTPSTPTSIEKLAPTITPASNLPIK